MTHICVGNLTIIGSDNGLSSGRRQAIIWTNAGILLIGLLVTNFCEIVIKIHTFSFKKMHLKMASAKWRPFCLGLNQEAKKYLYTRWWQALIKAWRWASVKAHPKPMGTPRLMLNGNDKSVSLCSLVYAISGTKPATSPCTTMTEILGGLIHRWKRIKCASR